MMKNKRHITTASILMTLALVGCTTGENPQATDPASPAAAPTGSPDGTAQQPTIPVAPGQEKSGKLGGAQGQPFDSPLIAASPKSNGASLTLPTNKDERLNIIPTGRPDPFGQIYEPIVPISPSNTTDPQKVPVLPPLPTAKKPVISRPPLNKVPGKTTTVAKTPLKPKVPGKTTTVAMKPPVKPVLPKLISPILPPVAIKPKLPPAPQPDAAKGVFVSGVILIGKVPQAIIQVPDEPTSRYVQPGQRLVNGVLVKRIEMSDGANPVVILEQYGIEVAKQVGEKPVEQQKDKDGNSPTTATVGNGSEQRVLGVSW